MLWMLRQFLRFTDLPLWHKANVRVGPSPHQLLTDSRQSGGDAARVMVGKRVQFEERSEVKESPAAGQGFPNSFGETVQSGAQGLRRTVCPCALDTRSQTNLERGPLIHVP